MVNTRRRDRFQQQLPAHVIRADMAALTAERIEELRVIFHSFDVNDDGRISKDEMAEVFEQSGRPVCADELNEAFHMLDWNDDGEISWSEFVHVARKLEERRTKQLMITFQTLDKTGSGRVSAKELMVTLRELGEDDLSYKQVKSIVTCLDANGDGFIDKEEFLQFMGTSS